MENNFQKPINYQDEKSFIKKIFKLFFTKYIFFPPKKKKILIFDNNGLNMLLSFFKRDEVGVYYRRYEQINLFILFLEMFKNFFSFSKEKISKGLFLLNFFT